MHTLFVQVTGLLRDPQYLGKCALNARTEATAKGFKDLGQTRLPGGVGSLDPQYLGKRALHARTEATALGFKDLGQTRLPGGVGEVWVQTRW